MRRAHVTDHKRECTPRQALGEILQKSFTRGRHALHTTVTTAAIRAREALSLSHGHIFSATKIVLAGDVALLPDDTATVGSQSDSDTIYHVHGTCPCADVPKAPANQCKPRIARGIMVRATALMAQSAAAPEDGTPGRAPEACG